MTQRRASGAEKEIQLDSKRKKKDKQTDTETMPLASKSC